MSGVLQVGNQQLTTSEVVSVINQPQLLPKVLREIIIEQAISPIEYTPAELEQIYQQLQKQQLPGKNSQQLKETAIRQLKLEKFKQTNWGKKIEAYFLRTKEKWDQALFHLIQTPNAEVAQELYFRISEGEQDFTNLAPEYSQGPETRTGGLVGPIRLQNLHPTLAKILSSSQAGQISPIFRVDNNFVLVRLEKYIPAQLDDALRQKLMDELFEQWIQTKIANHNQQKLTLESPFETLSTPSPREIQPKYADSPQVAVIEEQTMEEDFLEAPVNVEDVQEDNNNQPLTEINDAPQPLVSHNSSVLVKQHRKNQLAGVFFLIFMALGLGGLYFHYSQRVALRQSSPANAAVANAAATPPQEAFRVGVNQATNAANLTQSAQSEQEWTQVANYWQQAIFLMSTVTLDSKHYQVAQDKLTEYQNYLDYAQEKAHQPVDTFRVAVNHASEAANLTQFAQSNQEWDRVASYWQQAISLMETVEKDDPNYKVAITKIVEYGSNLNYAQSRATQ